MLSILYYYVGGEIGGLRTEEAKVEQRQRRVVYRYWLLLYHAPCERECYYVTSGSGAEHDVNDCYREPTY